MGTDKKNDGQMMNFKNKKDASSNEKNRQLTQTQNTMKKINVLRDGTAKVQEVKMNEKQVRAYVDKVCDCLFNMWNRWENEGGSREADTYKGIDKAFGHATSVSESEHIEMKFAFTKPEQCAIYLAFCFGAFNCLHFAELTTTSIEAVAMIKVLTSPKARAEILEG